MRIDKFPVSDDTYSSKLISSSSPVIVMQLYYVMETVRSVKLFFLFLHEVLVHLKKDKKDCL